MAGTSLFFPLGLQSASEKNAEGLLAGLFLLLPLGA
jgi:hypothetical protein